MAGAGEALSSTSELFAIRGAYLVNPMAIGGGGGGGTGITGVNDRPLPSPPRNCDEMPDEMKVFRQPDQSPLLPLELGRNSSITDALMDSRSTETARISANSSGILFANRENVDGTILEEDRQSDNGYGTTSECASDLVRSIRRVHSDPDVPLKVIQA